MRSRVDKVIFLFNKIKKSEKKIIKKVLNLIFLNKIRLNENEFHKKNK